MEAVFPLPWSGRRLRIQSAIGCKKAWPGEVTAQSLSNYLREHARPISYGYLNGSFPISAYQTIFALCPGSAEMPSAAGRSVPNWWRGWWHEE